MSMSNGNRAQTRRVHLLAGDDFQCALLGSLGFSTKFIESRTGLTVSQISYRLKCASIKRSDYRDGSSPVSSTVLNQSRFIAIPAVEQHLRQVVGEIENQRRSNNVGHAVYQKLAMIEAQSRVTVRTGTASVPKKDERAA